MTASSPEFRAVPAHGAGIMMMVLAMSLVPMIDVQAKLLLVGGLPVFQVVFLRMLWGTVILAPVMLVTHRSEIVPPQGWPRAILLGTLNLSAGFLFFASLNFIPIADAVAISFVQPLFVVLLSKVLLGERVGLSRWIALIVGFAASLLIIRPGYGSFDPGSLLALGAGLAMASYAILVKSSIAGLRRVSSVTLTFQTHFMGGLVALPLILPIWHGITIQQWGIALSMALFGLIGQYLIIKAYEFSDASLVAPFAYFEIITSSLVSWMFFHDIPDSITFIGVAILIVSSLSLLRKRKVHTPKTIVCIRRICLDDQENSG